MNDRKIETLIDDLIQEKGITLWDMIGAQYIDPEMKMGKALGLNAEDVKVIIENKDQILKLMGE